MPRALRSFFPQSGKSRRSIFFRRMISAALRQLLGHLVSLCTRLSWQSPVQGNWMQLKSNLDKTKMVSSERGGRLRLVGAEATLAEIRRSRPPSVCTITAAVAC